MSSCCTLRLNRRNAFSRDSPSCSRTSAKLTHPQTRPVGPDSYYKDFNLSQEGGCNFVRRRRALGNLSLECGLILRQAHTQLRAVRGACRPSPQEQKWRNFHKPKAATCHHPKGNLPNYTLQARGQECPRHTIKRPVSGRVGSASVRRRRWAS